jgi:nucleoside-diphosphate-sugar epimerase
MKALVTGGAGFIGSHLAEALCRRGARVVVLDNLSAGSLDNLAWKRPGDALEFVQGDAGDEALLRQITPGCDWVFHESALPSVPVSVAEPVKTNEQNLDTALKLLVAARDAGVKRFLFASSSAVYGDSNVSPKHEDLAPNPLSPYGLQKYAAETYGRLFHRLYGLETVGLRYFNVFGPRQAFYSAYSGVIARFCTDVLHGRRPTIYGDGLQSRDFIYVANVVAANLLAAETGGERVAGRVFNVGGGQCVTLLDLVAELNCLTGQSLQPQFEPPRAGDVRMSQADISRIRQAAGYDVDIPWQAGLKHTLDFYRRQTEPPKQ